MHRLLALFTVAGTALLLAACGGDSEEEALENVCNAADDIEQRVQSLEGLTLATATSDQVEEDLNAIGDDLETINDNAGDLREDEAGQVEDAAQSLEATVDESLSELGQSVSVQDAAKQIERSIAQLGDSVQQLFAPIDCPQ